MIAASFPVQRPPSSARLVVAAHGCIAHHARSRFVDILRAGDLVVANDAAPLPASLHGVHRPSGANIEVRLAGRTSLAHDDVHHFTAVVFGGGDFRARTEDRPLPPPLFAGDRLRLGPLSATIETVIDHTRLVSQRFGGPSAGNWEGLARHGPTI